MSSTIFVSYNYFPDFKGRAFLLYQFRFAYPEGHKQRYLLKGG